MVLEMCYKTIYNVLCRQSHEIKSNQRLLEKQVGNCLCNVQEKIFMIKKNLL